MGAPPAAARSKLLILRRKSSSEEEQLAHMVFSLAARLTTLFGGDIDRHYCINYFNDDEMGYQNTSEPELLAGYTKVQPVQPRSPVR